MRFFDLLFPTSQNHYRPVVLRAEALSVIFLGLFTAQIFYNISLFEQERLPRGNILGFATNIYEEELTKLTNQERHHRSLLLLTRSPLLDQAAQLKARNMFAESYWAHVAPSGTTPWHWFEVVSYDYLMAGENLAKDFNTSAGVVAGWMGSESHRDNLLNPNFTEIGMAVVNGQLLGRETTLVVQLFGTPLVETAAEEKNRVLKDLSAPGSKESATEGTELDEAVGVKSRALNVSESNSFNLQGSTLEPASGEPGRGVSTATRVRLAINPRNYTLSQILTIVALALLVILFLADSVVLWRLGIERKNSHSLLHAGTLTLLLIAVVIKGGGAIL